MIRGDARYRVTCKLELTKRRLVRWSGVKVGDIFRRLEGVEVSISELQEWKDRHGDLVESKLAELRSLLSQYHSLL